MALPKFFYDNRFDDGTPAASTTAVGDFNVLNLRAWRPYKWWKPTALPATVTVDCGSALAADFLAVWGHDLFTQGATIEARGSTDNFSGSNVLLATKTPTTDDPFVVEFASASYRYWRIRITGTTMPSLAIAAIGAVLTAPVGLDEGFDPIGRKAEGQRPRSVTGNPLGSTTLYEVWDEEIIFNPVEWAWLRATFEPAWEEQLRDKPFIFAWDIGDHPTELHLATTDGKFSAKHSFGTYAALKFKIAGLVG
jgi:hypothetical protein